MLGNCQIHLDAKLDSLGGLAARVERWLPVGAHRAHALELKGFVPNFEGPVIKSPSPCCAEARVDNRIISRLEAA